MPTQPTPDTPGVNDPGPGRRLGVDVGTVRIGVAVSDSSAVMATPVETIARDSGFRGPDGSDVDRILELIQEYGVVEVVVGLPRTLQGHGSQSVKHAREIAFRVQRRLKRAGSPCPVRMADERLTTVSATAALRASGVSEKAGRKVIDQAAAVEILQAWLDGRQRVVDKHNP
ncbi:Holliday junction resolvase RuvX [Corynebacterium tapiri]|uniref:Holliday junction resolvase RuvX n=1 Tax=Corynebacterium tapiri TaxID=1448266 RepID=UPI001FE80419|nr:Holliday junction resolvase RuvX [Corynebacterium tapiri]